MQVHVAIKPGSRHREEVIVSDDGSLVVFTKAPAVEGKANEAAVRLLARHFGVSRSRVTLLRGHTSKRKVFKVET